MRPRKYPVFAIERLCGGGNRDGNASFVNRSQIQNQKVQQRVSEMINQQKNKKDLKENN